MLKLEQLAALVVAAGLAIVSYLLFFSWAGGGGYERRERAEPPSSQTASRLDQPALAVVVVKAGQMVAHLLRRDGKPQLVAQAADAGHGAVGILERLTEQGLGLFRIAADSGVQRCGVRSHRDLGYCSNAIQGRSSCQAACSMPSSCCPRAEASFMLRASMQSTLRSWA